jgi:hypothetical protein
MGRHTDHRTLISRGRKAGLNARELYSALSSQPGETAEELLGQADCNGYVAGHNAQGKRVFLPIQDRTPR